MSFRSVLIPALSLSLFLLACEDKSPAGPAANDTKGLLTASKWKKSAHTVSPAVDFEGDGVMVTDLHAAMGACVADDVTTFTADGKWSLDEGATKCDPGDPQKETGTWTLSADQKTLTMASDSDAVSMTLTVVSIGSGSLKVSMAGDWDGGDHTEVLTFSAQ